LIVLAGIFATRLKNQTAGAALAEVSNDADGPGGMSGGDRPSVVRHIAMNDTIAG
jgi:hypothetical protein